MESIKTVSDEGFELKEEYYKYDYQVSLTKQLDEYSEDFDEFQINRIALWKLNRYFHINEETLNKINQIKPTDSELNENLTLEILDGLLRTDGIRLAMASTILRFKNPNIYQIIDQRVCRILGIISFTKLTSSKKIDEQKKLYLAYLIKLRKICDAKNVKFINADRVFYNADKDINRNVKLTGY